MDERREAREAWRGGWTRWVVAGPPTAFLLAFFLVPALIVVAATYIWIVQLAAVRRGLPVRAAKPQTRD